MNFFDELLKRISSKGDVGVAAIGFVLGYVFDLRNAVVGLTPGVAGTLGATVAIGLKNFLESVWDRIWTYVEELSALSRRRASAQEQASHLEKVVAEVTNLSRESEVASQLKIHAGRVRSDYELWRKNLIRGEQLQSTVTDFVEQYRRVRANPTS